MKYDFDTVINRKNTNSLKWDVKENELPMWVADMDFKTAPEIIASIQKRAEHGIFGYTIIPDEWYRAYIGHWKNRYSYTMKKNWLMFCTGVIPAISSTVRKLTTPAEKIVIQTPVYNIFYNCILNNGRNVLENRLIYNNGQYSIDFDDLEKKLSDPQTTLMILCNPHNPVGRIWNKEELSKIGELCKTYGVTVISDEIHCDITDPGVKYTPFASVSDICRDISVTCITPTKAFNLAGLQTSAICIPNDNLRHRVNRAINTDEVAEPNAFAIDAAVSAFSDGQQWLDELKAYLFENKKIVNSFMTENKMPIKTVTSQATYLLWLDCSELPLDGKELANDLREKTGLYLSSGIAYGENGRHFLRLNIACPKTVLYDGLNRLKSYCDMVS